MPDTGPLMRDSNAGEATAYDSVPYVSEARNSSSIDRLATLGRLLGMGNAHPTTARVLELGGGDGGNLIPMAVSFPGATFLSVDLAATAVERGNDAVRELGLTNIELRTGSFASVEAGAFDYVIAHGIYSWVPPDAREELLSVIRERMAPAGLAFVSYNAMPGSHIRGVLRQMMLLHTREISDPREKLAQARSLLALLASVPGEAGDIYRPLLHSEVGRALIASDDLLYHDDLAEVSDPFFFSDFIAAARRHGLEFAAEANFHQMSLNGLPPELAASLGELGSHDLIAKEQYLDFITCRPFRQTVLCHREAQLDRRVDTAKVRGFRFSSQAVAAAQADADAGVVEFRHPNKSVLRTDNPVAIAALRYLNERFPRSVPFDELALAAGIESPAQAGELAETLFRAFSVGVVGFHVSEPAAVFELSERPAASPWARRRASTGRVVNLYHELITLGEADAAILQRLDGTMIVAGIAAELGRTEAQVMTAVEDLASHGLLLA